MLQVLNKRTDIFRMNIYLDDLGMLSDDDFCQVWRALGNLLKRRLKIKSPYIDYVLGMRH